MLSKESQPKPSLSTGPRGLDPSFHKSMSLKIPTVAIRSLYQSFNRLGKDVGAPRNMRTSQWRWLRCLTLMKDICHIHLYHLWWRAVFIISKEAGCFCVSQFMIDFLWFLALRFIYPTGVCTSSCTARLCLPRWEDAHRDDRVTPDIFTELCLRFYQRCLEKIKTSWWLNHLFEKYARQNGFIFPNFRGENKKMSWELQHFCKNALPKWWFFRGDDITTVGIR